MVPKRYFNIIVFGCNWSGYILSYILEIIFSPFLQKKKKKLLLLYEINKNSLTNHSWKIQLFYIKSLFIKEVELFKLVVN